MSYTIYHNEQDDIVEVVHIGTLTSHELELSIPAAASRCKLNQCWHVICDIRQSKYKLTNADEFTIIHALSENFNPQSIIALLADDEQLSDEQIRLLQQNADIHELKLKITNSTRQATDWLNQ